ncbi:MAG: wax ester/triacylglycerol synthase family O-acyltransferase, partial [Actinobacteria bacterium]|nr:wax ester/triacylglycerol synthase family O-acyltransferase [Actinomycetota bacterium]
ADPLERLAWVHNRTTNSKAMTDAMGARNMTEMSKVSPALWMSLGAQLYTRLSLANRGVGPIFSTVVTNVPGPPVPIYSAGARMESMMGLLCLTDGLGLGHVVQSYTREATIAFTADREMMDDPEFYAQCIRESFGELRDAAVGNAGPAKGKPAPDKRSPKTTAKKPAAKKRAAPKKKPSEPAKGGTNASRARSKPKAAHPLKGPTTE